MLALYHKYKYEVLLRVSSVLLAIMLTAGYASSAYADGGYLPEQAFRKLPSIPIQRAILSYKNGVETLVIESTVNGDGQSFGWIIPLPAEPTEIQKVPTELLDVFANNTEPDVVHHQLTVYLILFSIISFLMLIFIFSRERFILTSLLFLLLLFLLAILTLPRLSGYTAAFGERVLGVDIKNRLEIGNYDITVLKATQAETLNVWLEKNGFRAVPASGTEVINDYIKNNWIFIATKLRREGSGLCTPHPLLVKFPVSIPIYPMRLTSLSSSDVLLQLFVIGGQKAAFLKERPDNVKLEFSDKYYATSKSNDYEVFQGTQFKKTISHPFAKNVIWPSSVISRFQGTLSPANMTMDYAFSFSGGKPFRQNIYSKAGAVATALPYAFVIWCGGLLFAAISVAKRGKIYTTFNVLLPTLLLASLFTGFIYIVLPKTEVRIIKSALSILTKSQRSSLEIEMLKGALDSYKRDIRAYPTSSQGLKALIRNPGIRGWNGSYLINPRILNDPWGKPYHYDYPGKHGAYDLFSYGEDNAPGGEDQSKDIKSWK